MTKKALCIIMFALGALCNAAHAQDTPLQLKFRPFVGLGLTAGGDDLATVQFTNGDSQTLHAGGLVDFKLGVDVRFTPMWSAQVSVGYHIDSAGGDNGDLKFKRVPVEVLAHAMVHPKWRIGGGARFVSGAKLSGDGVLGGNSVDFDARTSSIVEAEFFPLDSLGIRVRYVNERYKIKGTGTDVNGSHGGVLVSYYFF